MTGVLTGVLLAASSSKTSSGGSTFIIFILLIAVVGYFLLIRPQRQRARRQQQQQSSIGVGDEIVTVGGIVGRVVAVDADRVTIVTGEETVGFAAKGSSPTRLVLVRNAIARKVEPPVETPESDDEHDDESDDEHDQTVTELGFDGRASGDEDDEGDSPAGDGRAAEGGGTGP